MRMSWPGSDFSPTTRGGTKPVEIFSNAADKTLEAWPGATPLRVEHQGRNTRARLLMCVPLLGAPAFQALPVWLGG